MEQKKCPNCGKDLKQKEGKREKKFCNSTCRSGFWQKNNKKEKKYKLVPIEEYKKLTEQPNKAYDADKLKESVNDEPKLHKEPKKEINKPKWIIREQPKMPAGLTTLQQIIWKKENKIR